MKSLNQKGISDPLLSDDYMSNKHKGLEVISYIVFKECQLASANFWIPKVRNRTPFARLEKIFKELA